MLLRQVAQPWGPILQWQEEWLQYSLWGRQAIDTAKQWLQAVKWPTEPQDAKDIGVSWTEIALSMIMMRGMWLPLKRKTDLGSWVVIQPGTTLEAINHGTDLLEQTTAASGIIQQCRALVPQPTWPSFCKSMKCASLYNQGFFQWTTGLIPRPEFPFQQEIGELLKTHLVQPHFKLGPLPNLQTDPGFRIWDDAEATTMSWEERSRRMTSRLHQVRRARKLISE